MTPPDLRAQVLSLYDAAIAAAAPAAAVSAAFAANEVTLELGRDRQHWIVAVGKAALAMAQSAAEECATRRLAVRGGLVVADRLNPSATPAVELRELGLTLMEGDHPVPGVRSRHAADALAALLERIGRNDVVIVCISGGTSSLIGAAITGVREEDLAQLHALLLGAGVPINRINAVRKRFSRWGAGRLAAALECARVIPILLADVPNEDPSMIGSGPVSPDPLGAWHVERILRDAGLAKQIPLSIASTLGAVRAGVVPETPKPGSEVFARVEEPFVVGNSAALEGAAAEAQRMGHSPVLLSLTSLTGDATAAGRVLAHTVARAAPGTCLIWGGETTVRLPTDFGLGGRCQQLALSAAESLADLGAAAWLLAAGSDGQDGPAPASGAVVNQHTWRLSADRGADPQRALERCDAFGALRAADAILPSRHTGTNVMDIVVAIRE